jgi:acetyltransferase-like isoleucine patch superfamily enzyme
MSLPSWRRWLMLAAFWQNRGRRALLSPLLRGRVEFGPGCDIWTPCLSLRGEGRVRFGARNVVSRETFPLVLDVEEGGEVCFGDECWFRGKYRPNVVTCFRGGRLELGPRSILNGAIVSAKSRVTIGEKAMISWNVTIIDSDLHGHDNDRAPVVAPVVIGDFVLLYSGVTVLPGVTIGAHSVIGANSLVTDSIPDHVLAAGSPARPIKTIGNRDRCA